MAPLVHKDPQALALELQKSVNASVNHMGGDGVARWPRCPGGRKVRRLAALRCDCSNEPGAESHIKTNANHGTGGTGSLRPELNQNAAELSLAQQYIVRPFQAQIGNPKPAERPQHATPIARLSEPTSRGTCANVQLSDRHTAPPGGASHSRPRRPRPAL